MLILMMKKLNFVKKINSKSKKRKARIAVIVIETLSFSCQILLTESLKWTKAWLEALQDNKIIDLNRRMLQHGRLLKRKSQKLVERILKYNKLQILLVASAKRKKDRKNQCLITRVKPVKWKMFRIFQRKRWNSN